MDDEKYPPEEPLEPWPPEEDEWGESKESGETWPPLPEEPPKPLGEGPAPWVPEPGRAREETAGETPWDRRDQLGLLEAFTDSWRMLLLRPSQFFRELAPRGGFAEPLLFFVMFCLVLTVFSFPAELCANYLNQWVAQRYVHWYQDFLSQTGAPADLQGLVDRFVQESPGWMEILLGRLCCMVANPVRWLIGLFIVAALYAVCGLVFSGKMDYEMVFRVLAFSEVARTTFIINPIPLLRELVFLIHWLVLLSIGFKLTGEMPTGKAVLLALLPIVILIGLSCCCCCGTSLLFSAALQP